MLFSKRSTAKASLYHSNREASFCKACHPLFKFVILSEAKDLRFVARAETIARKMSPRAENWQLTDAQA
jgi:hypothetical protein